MSALVPIITSQVTHPPTSAESADIGEQGPAIREKGYHPALQADWIVECPRRLASAAMQDQVKVCTFTNN